MRITSLVENTSSCELRAKHGLSLYIETRRHKILFDLGPDQTLFENAKKRSIDLTKIDTVIISHGHFDHGGALREFLAVNPGERVYVQRSAFEPHYSKVLFMKAGVGIDKALQTQPQVILLDGDHRIDDELFLFTVDKTDRCRSPMNDALYDKNGRDAFAHEQNLIITENQTVLIMGCGHAGVVNIMDKAKSYEPKVCIGGYHLFNPMTKQSTPPALLDEIAGELRSCKNTRFYTCHCTGIKAFQYMARQVPNLAYLACGESIDI